VVEIKRLAKDGEAFFFSTRTAMLSVEVSEMPGKETFGSN
jgi:hypothetical protein